MQSFAETALCTRLGGDEKDTFGASVGTDSSREYSFQNRHAPLYLNCITPCEAQHQRGLLLLLADIRGDWNYFQFQLFCPSWQHHFGDTRSDPRHLMHPSIRVI